MVDVDYERLELILGRDVHESLHDQFNIEKMARDAVKDEVEGTITVKTGEFMLVYDLYTYEQVFGSGGG
jgi:hypothetical protein